MFRKVSDSKLKGLCQKIIFCFFICCAFKATATATATEYYVSPNGTVAWPNCTTESNPCLASNTSTAFLDAAAGDTVYFLDGTYSGLTYNSASYRVASWIPTNSGTPGSPITFKSLNKHGAHLVGLQTNTNVCNMAVPVIGSYGHTHIVWDGFIVSAVDGSDNALMAEVYFYVDSNYCTVSNCEIRGATHSTGGACNYEGVRIENSDYVTVEYNEIHGFNEVDENHNTSALKTYDSYYATIRNNEFYDNSTHLYIKGNGNGNFSVYNNYFKDGMRGIFNTMNLVYTEHNHSYYNNLFNNVYNGLTDGGVGESVANDASFYNNTFYNASSTGDIAIFATSDAGHQASVYNNIFYKTSGRSIVTRPVGSTLKQADHNLYYNGINVTLSLYSGNRTYSTLSAWQASTELYAAFDSGCGSNRNPGCGSLLEDPLFVNASGTYADITDFVLDIGSPAKGAGRGGIDMGANIALVGITGSDSAAPPVPPEIPLDFKGPSN